MQLALESVEVAAGDFAADIVARDLSTNQLVVIENQYGNTDHRHLGQIITYASVLGAQAVIWIAESMRNEHKSAIDFLNRNLKESLQLFALEVSVFKIDDSRPALSLNLVCSPPESISTGPKDAETSEIKLRYRSFFQALIDELRVQHQFTNAKQAQLQSWYTFSSENSRVFVYSASFARGGRVRAEVYLDCKDEVRNKALFDRLKDDERQIAEEFGAELSWERLDHRQACRVATYLDGEIDSPTEVLEDIRKWTIDRLLKFRQIFPGRIAKLIASSS